MTFLQLIDKAASGEATKEEEMQVLEHLHEKLSDSDSYLASFFTEDLIRWVSVALRDDMPPDLWANFYGLKEENLAKVAELKKLVNDQDAQLEAERGKVIEAYERADKIVGELKVVEADWERGQKAYDKLYDEWQKADTIIREVADEAQDAWFKSSKVDPEAVRAITAKWFK